MENQNDRDTYVIPPNFVDTGTFFGGMFKVRNVIEAGMLAAGIGIPVFLFLPGGADRAYYRAVPDGSASGYACPDRVFG